MNPVFKVFSKIIIVINNFIDNLDKRYVDMIRQIFFMIFFVLWVVGAVFGIIMGKNAASKGGITLIEKTNDVFDMHIQQEKDDRVFQDVLAQEMQAEGLNPTFPKETVENKEPLTPDSEDLILESDESRKKTDSFPVGKDDKPVDSPRVMEQDETKPLTEVSEPEVDSSVERTSADDNAQTEPIEPVDKEPERNSKSDNGSSNMEIMDNSEGIVE